MCRLGDIAMRVDATRNNVDYLTLYGSLVDRMFDSFVKGASVLDIGAHKGYFGARCLFDGATLVHSYEPASDNYSALERSARGVDAWHPFHCAVGDRRGTITLRRRPDFRARRSRATHDRSR